MAAQGGGTVSAFEAGVGARGRSAGRLAVDVADFGARTPGRRIDIPGRARSGPHLARKPNILLASLTAALRLVLPVLLLTATLAVCTVYNAISVEGLSTFAGRPATLGLALLPATFFVVHLTNRRYGAAYAFAQVAVTMLLGVGLQRSIWPLSDTGAMRAALALGVAFFFAQSFAIVVFDGLRGPRWWTAPLLASVAGGIVFSVILFPAAFAGGSVAWMHEMVGYLAYTSLAAVLLLVPYALIRSIIPPSAGYGGY